MKKDTSVKTIDLDNLLNEDVAPQSVQLTESVSEPVTEKPNMDWDAIIAEWFYRLPKGYAEQPYSDSELRILDRVVNEYNNGGFKTVITEASISDITNKALLSFVSESNKDNDFQEFISNIPDGIPTTVMLNFLNKLSKTESKQFVNNLYTETDIESLNSSQYNDGVGKKIFELKPEGMGKGEFFIAWLVRGARNSGGGKSFDVRLGNKKYEVKDYRPDDSSGIRLGTKGKVTRFKFWYHIIDTINYINSIYDIDPTFAILGAAGDQAKQIHNNGDFFKGGEFSGETKALFQAFYENMHEDFTSNVAGYTMITLRGSNVPPVSYSIEELTKISGNSLNITLTSDAMSPDDNKILVLANKLKYVRNPKSLNEDLQTLVNELVGSLPFIVFRKTKINITTEFRYKSISQGVVYIIEADLADKEKSVKSTRKKKG